MWVIAAAVRGCELRRGADGTVVLRPTVELAPAARPRRVLEPEYAALATLLAPLPLGGEPRASGTVPASGS